MSTEIEIRPAVPREGAELTRIAVASKAHWGYDAEFMARAAPFLAVDSEYIERHDVFVAVRGGSVIGFYALVADSDVAVLDHLWLRPEDIGHGVGRRLFEHARQRAAARGASRLELEAEPRAAGFYRRMGGRPVRKVTTELGREFDVYSFDLGGSSASGSGSGGASAPGTT